MVEFEALLFCRRGDLAIPILIRDRSRSMWSVVTTSELQQSGFMPSYSPLSWISSIALVTDSQIMEKGSYIGSFFLYLLHPREGARVCIYWDYN